MEEIEEYRQGLLTALKGVVDELAITVTEIPSSAWHAPNQANTHTPHFILAHLLALEHHVFSVDTLRIRDEEAPLLPVFDDNAWMARHYEPNQPVHVILGEFTHLRTAQVGWLGGLSPADWSLVARHPWWGVRTLQWWAELQLEVSIGHLQALAACLAG